jgi:uncharacterized repeat protein (TIGR04076 family)
MKGFKFKLIKGKCPSVPESGNGSLDFSLTPDDICLNAVHAIFPYFLTLINGGWFTWVEPGDGVIVQCANPDCSLQMKVFSENLGKVVRVKTLYAKGGCPKGHRKGEEFVFDSSSLSFCPKALDGLYPYIQLLERGERLPWSRDGEPNILKCPYSDCGNVEFAVEFAEEKPLTTPSKKS